MKDSETIIKTLECCINDDCDNCPETFGNCEHNAMRKALDLINRQQAEIERLEKHELSEAMKFNKSTINQIKSEAIKEFAEKVKEEVTYYEDTCGVFTPFVDCRDIDSLVKEMVGENSA